jgi:hypothetical protein
MSPWALFYNAVRFFEPATTKNAPSLDVKEAGFSCHSQTNWAGDLLVNPAGLH